MNNVDPLGPWTQYPQPENLFNQRSVFHTPMAWYSSPAVWWVVYHGLGMAGQRELLRSTRGLLQSGQGEQS